VERGFKGPLDRVKLRRTAEEFGSCPIDSFRARGLQSPLLDGKVIPNRIQRSPSFPKKMLSPQSQIYVIDTAIVRNTHDTTRHLYSFNAKAKWTTDLTQNVRGGLRVDTQRETNTYDASNNILSDLYEQWSNGQWVNSLRWTWTYDAKNNMLSCSVTTFTN